MSERRKRDRASAARARRAADQGVPPPEVDRAALEAEFAQARAVVTAEALPAIEDFRPFMLAQNRKLEVVPFLDHIEGPQVVVHISRPDGRISATLMANVTPDGIQPSWDITSSGRVKTHWVERIAGGLPALTRESVFARLKDLYLTDFS